MICQNCGRPVEPHDVFCGRCGYLLSTANIGHPGNTGGQRSLYVASQTVVVEVPECRVVPGETARFPFSVHGGERSYSIHEFNVSSDNPNFNPGWVHIVKTTDGMRSSRYILEIRPANIGRQQYGSYPISIRCAAPDAFQHAIGQCTLIIKPCARLTGKPTFRTWPGGVLSMSLENCGGVPIDVSVSISHHGSSWSKGWEFELETEDGPFEFKETFEPPADGRGAEFDLDVSAEGVSLIHMPLRPRNFFVARKHIIVAAVVLIAAALGITLAKVLPGPALTAQSISFTSEPSKPAVGSAYVVAATGGGSGNPVTFSIDAQSASTCSVAGTTVTFGRPGDCVIDANQAGNDQYSAAPQAQQKVTVTGSGTKMTQAIVFTSKPPSPVVGATYVVTAKGGGSDNPVTFAIDGQSASVCSVSGATVTFSQPGTCVIDANQAGNDRYLSASQAQQIIAVTGSGTKTAQSIVFTSRPPSPVVGATYVVTARGGGSGNPVTFTIDAQSASVCSVSGATVTFNQAGSCVIDANEAGNDRYLAASQAQQIVPVKQSQTISFTSKPPGNVFVGTPYKVTAEATSGNPVTFTIDAQSASVCSVSGADVTFSQAGSCVIDANQAGNDQYLPARQVQQEIPVNPQIP